MIISSNNMLRVSGNRTLLFGLCFLWFNSFRSQTIDSSYVDGEVYFKYNSSSGSLIDSDYLLNNELLNFIIPFGIDTLYVPFPGLNTDLDQTFRLNFSEFSLVDSLIQELEAISEISYAEKSPLIYAFHTPNDLQGVQWGLYKIQAEEAWNISQGSGQVKIAIVDNAVSTIHQDIFGQIWENPNEIPNNFIDDDLNGFIDDVKGYDVADMDNNTNPPSTSGTSSPFVHGTHCAGIGSAETNNGIGIASIGYNCKIIPVKCSKNAAVDEGASLPNAYDGVYYAMRAGADVISMSWGGTGGVFITGQQIINAANAMGIVLVAAAGNSNTSTPFYPAAYPNVISVGATDNNDGRAYFSNYGSTIDVMAPGFGIYSTLSGGNNDAYGNLSGTSMACPLVAGICGLLLSENPGLSPSQLEQQLKGGCDDIDPLNPGYENLLGAGRVNAFKSLQLTQNISFPAGNEILIYPNPSKGKITFVASDSADKRLSLYDNNGRLVYFELLSDQFREIELSIEPGIYFLIIENDYLRDFRKLVVISN